MAQINLLPWREEARKIMLMQFLTAAGLSAIAAILILVLVNIFLRGLIRSENHRMDFIQTAFSQKLGDFTTLRDEKLKQGDIEAQLKYLFNLRQKDIHIVQLMNELNVTVPASVVINKIRQFENKVTLEGKAESAVDITQFMKKLSKSSYFNKPVLSKINAAQGTGDVGKVFQIEVEQKNGTQP